MRLSLLSSHLQPGNRFHFQDLTAPGPHSSREELRLIMDGSSSPGAWAAPLYLLYSILSLVNSRLTPSVNTHHLSVVLDAQLSFCAHAACPGHAGLSTEDTSCSPVSSGLEYSRSSTAQTPDLTHWCWRRTTKTDLTYHTLLSTTEAQGRPESRRFSVLEPKWRNELHLTLWTSLAFSKQTRSMTRSI